MKPYQYYQDNSEKPTSFDLSVFQLNPPLWVGEIVFDDEIPCGDEICLDGRWVDLISSEAKPKISSASADFILASARISLYYESSNSYTKLPKLSFS